MRNCAQMLIYFIFVFGKQIAYILILQKALEMQLKAIKLVWNETDLAQNTNGR